MSSDAGSKMIDRLSAAVDRATLQRFARFVAVGFVNMLFGYAVYALLVVVRFEPQLALVLSWVLGVIWNYFTTARFVFGQRGFRRFPAYVICYVAIYGMNAGLLNILIGTGLSPLLAQALLLPIVAVLSFVSISWALTGGAANQR